MSEQFSFIHFQRFHSFDISDETVSGRKTRKKKLFPVTHFRVYSGPINWIKFTTKVGKYKNTFLIGFYVIKLFSNVSCIQAYSWQNEIQREFKILNLTEIEYTGNHLWYIKYVAIDIFPFFNHYMRAHIL